MKNMRNKDIKENDNGSTILGEAVAAARINDAFSNPGARTGFGELNLINSTEYPLTRLSQDWNLLTSLYRTSWIVQRVCNIIPEDSLTDLSFAAPGLDSYALATINNIIIQTKLRQRIIESIRWARLYGGAAAIILIDGQDEDMSLPLDVDSILPGSFSGLFVVDRWSGIYPSTRLVADPSSPDFGLPYSYEVRDDSGVMKYTVHHSRVLRFIGTALPFYEEIAELHWGSSSIEAMYDDLIRRDNITHNIANLTFRSNLSVYQIENLDQIFATAGAAAQRRMYSMLQAMSILESNLGIRLVNKGDDIQQIQYTFTGLPEVLDGAMLDVSGATGIPATRLFGRSPAGMNATGESDEKIYRGILAQNRSASIQPALERLAPILCMSALGAVPADAEFKIPDLNELTPSEKMEVIDRRSQTLERLFMAGTIPANVLLDGVRNAENEMGIVSSIQDDDINSVKGKYQKDLSPSADPFGGMFQGEEANESDAALAEQDATADNEIEQEESDIQEISNDDINEYMDILEKDISGGHDKGIIPGDAPDGSGGNE